MSEVSTAVQGCGRISQYMQPPPLTVYPPDHCVTALPELRVNACDPPDAVATSRNGGFGGSPRHDPHLLYTTSAVQLLALFERLDLLDVDATAACEPPLPLTSRHVFCAESLYPCCC